MIDLLKREFDSQARSDSSNLDLIQEFEPRFEELWPKRCDNDSVEIRRRIITQLFDALKSYLIFLPFISMAYPKWASGSIFSNFISWCELNSGLSWFSLCWTLLLIGENIDHPSSDFNHLTNIFVFQFWLSPMWCCSYILCYFPLLFG